MLAKVWPDLQNNTSLLTFKLTYHVEPCSHHFNFTSKLDNTLSAKAILLN